MVRPLTRGLQALNFFWHYGLFSWQVRSGYYRHSPFTRSGLVHLLAVLTWVNAPRLIVQLGVGEGVSVIAMLLATRLRFILEARLVGYDHFTERGVGEAVERQVFERNIRQFNLQAQVEAHQADALQLVCKLDEIDLLNIDIDNTYEKLQRLYELGWFDSLSAQGFAVVEGGYSQHQGRSNSRGIMRFCQDLQARGFQTMTIQRYPGVVLVRRFLDSDQAY